MKNLPDSRFGYGAIEQNTESSVEAEESMSFYSLLNTVDNPRVLFGTSCKKNKMGFNPNKKNAGLQLEIAYFFIGEE